MKNFSQTQFGNLMQLVSAVVVVFGGNALNPEQINSLWIVVGLVGEVVGFIVGWAGRHKKGDLTVAGFRK